MRFELVNMADGFANSRVSAETICPHIMNIRTKSRSRDSASKSFWNPFTKWSYTVSNARTDFQNLSWKVKQRIYIGVQRRKKRNPNTWKKNAELSNVFHWTGNIRVRIFLYPLYSKVAYFSYLPKTQTVYYFKYHAMKYVFSGHMRAAKVQLSLHVRTVWSRLSL